MKASLPQRPMKAVRATHLLKCLRQAFARREVDLVVIIIFIEKQNSCTENITGAGISWRGHICGCPGQPTSTAYPATTSPATD